MKSSIATVKAASKTNPVSRFHKLTKTAKNSHCGSLHHRWNGIKLKKSSRGFVVLRHPILKIRGLISKGLRLMKLNTKKGRKSFRTVQQSDKRKLKLNYSGSKIYIGRIIRCNSNVQHCMKGLNRRSNQKHSAKNKKSFKLISTKTSNSGKIPCKPTETTMALSSAFSPSGDQQAILKKIASKICNSETNERILGEYRGSEIEPSLMITSHIKA